METFTKDQPLTLKQKASSFLKNKKKALLLGSAITGLMVLFLFLLLSQRPQIPQTPQLSPAPPAGEQVPQPETSKLPDDLVPPQPPRSPQSPQTPETLETPQPPPQLSFEKYQLATNYPTLPDSITLYTFKINYSDEEVSNFAAKFGLFDLRPAKGGSVLATNLENPKNYGYLLFNKKTGSFTFQSFGIHKPRFAASANPVQIAENFLKENGLLDETVFYHASYQIKGFEDLTFVEFHRNWEKAGLPILNIVGLLNLDETIKLANLKLGLIDPETPDNSDIFFTSDNQDGKTRPNDFNTITVAVNNDSRIISIESNLRPIEKSETIANALLTPQEAFENVQKGKGLFQLTMPSGEGTTDFARVYPQNLASAKEAVVTDFILAYLEKPPNTPKTQNFLQPVYFFKGHASLDSGYRVNWVQAVPTIASIANILGDTIKLGTFTPTPAPPTPTPTPFPTPTPLSGATPTPTPPSKTASPCIPDEAHLDPIYDLAGLGRVGQWTVDQETAKFASARTGHDSQWYFIPPKDQTLPDLDQVLAEFEKLGIPGNRLRQRQALEQEWSGQGGTDKGYDDPNCPKRLTGGSPTLFVYAPEGTSLTIKPGANITYSDPPVKASQGKTPGVGFNSPSVEELASDEVWQITVDKNRQLNVNGLTRNYLYYEYEPITFQKPKEGWLIKKAELENFARKTLSPALKLKPLEEDRLVFELAHASFNLPADNLIFLGPIGHQNVRSKLPLEINPKPDKVLRLHFYLSSKLPKHPKPPQLTPIPRTDFMILELGAIKQ